MAHEKYIEMLELNILGELSKDEQVDLENHLFECEECSSEYTKLKKFYTSISTHKTNIPTEHDLMNARKRLFNTINSERVELKTEKKLPWYSIFSNKYSLAFGSVVLVLIGMFVGYLIFKNESQNLLTNNSIDLDKIDRGDVRISDVSFPDKFSENAEFEIKLEDENLSSYKGNLDDVVIQKLLASAIKETKNPGFKIRTAKSFTELLPRNFMPDQKIKDAFITSLKTDKNPGVRKEALKALINFQYDESVRDALLFVLEQDENASNRMLAINTLLTMNATQSNIDENIKSKLIRRIANENNKVIKSKTEKLLIGGK